MQQKIKSRLWSMVEFVPNVLGIKAIPDRLSHPRSPNVNTLDVPGYRQCHHHTCGYVSAWMVLRYFFPEVSGRRFYDLMGPAPEAGYDPDDISIALQRSGLHVRESNCLGFGDICDNIENGRPVIVLVRKTRWVDHYCVVYGVNTNRCGVFIAGDGIPWIGRNERSWSDFRRAWQPPGWGLVCSRA